jgi:hypothetical protein
VLPPTLQPEIRSGAALPDLLTVERLVQTRTISKRRDVLLRTCGQLVKSLDQPFKVLNALFNVSPERGAFIVTEGQRFKISPISIDCGPDCCDIAQ